VTTAASQGYHVVDVLPGLYLAVSAEPMVTLDQAPEISLGYEPDIGAKLPGQVSS
jgi:hypothetical protein